MPGQLASDCAIVALIGGLLSLDRTGAFQIMISRPLVTAPLVGLVLGYSGVGLTIGVLIELLYMADRPVGGYMPTHETALAILTTTLSVAFITGLTQASETVLVLDFIGTLTVVAPVLLVSILVAPLYRTADVFSRRMNEGLFDEAHAALDAAGGSSSTLWIKNLKGLFNFFWPVSAMLFVTVFVLSLAFFILGSKLSWVDGSKLYPATAGFLILGVALALNAIKSKGTLIVFSACGILTVFIWGVVK